jgi:pantothenate kinase
MPELLKVITREKAYDCLADTKKELDQNSYDLLVDAIKAAEESKNNVSNIETQMPDLLKKVIYKAVDDQLIFTKKSLNQRAYNYLIDAVKVAKEA